MRTRTALLLCTPILLIAGCADSDRVYNNVYIGLQSQDKLDPVVAAEQQPEAKSPSYQEYSAERKKLLDDNNKPGTVEPASDAPATILKP